VADLVSEGIRLIDEKDFERAITLLSQALEDNPNSTEIMANLGAALHFSGHSDAALAQYDKSLALDPKCWPALINAASMRIQRGNPAWAISAIDQATPLAAVPDQLVCIHVRTHIEMGLFQKARNTLKSECLRLSNQSECWLLLGVTCQFLNQLHEAVAAFRYLQSLGPASPDVQARHGRLIGDCGGFGAARSREDSLPLAA
jgi:Flp pilus assembly protein TadD